MKKALLNAVFWLSALVPIGDSVALNGHTEAPVVLVAGYASEIPPLSARELRQLYLGVPVIKEGAVVQPLVNRSDPELFELFLQKILHVSERYYDRQLLSRLFRLGSVPPKSFENEVELLRAVRESTDLVTFVEAEEASLSENIKVVQVLW